MADVHDKAARSYNMSRIRSKNTKPEIILRKALFANGFRFKLHVRELPGKPDIVLKKYNVAIFVHGCFWHGHTSCKYFVAPKTRTQWWLNKIGMNTKRDSQNLDDMKKMGWKIIVVWECDLRPGKVDNSVASVIKRILKP